MYRLMIIDDEKNVLHSLRRILSKQKEWKIVTCSDPLEAADIAKNSTLIYFFLTIVCQE